MVLVVLVFSTLTGRLAPPLACPVKNGPTSTVGRTKGLHTSPSWPPSRHTNKHAASGHERIRLLPVSDCMLLCGACLNPTPAEGSLDI